MIVCPLCGLPMQEPFVVPDDPQDAIPFGRFIIGQYLEKWTIDDGNDHGPNAPYGFESKRDALEAIRTYTEQDGPWPACVWDLTTRRVVWSNVTVRA